jgi:CRP-like cAMP-binding protein
MHPDPDRLAGVPLFAGLTEDDRSRVASWLEVEEFGPGKRLAIEGAIGYVFFVLDEGRVRIEHEGKQLGTLGPGQVFGEMAFFVGHGRRNADVIAETDVRVFSMFGTGFQEMKATIPDVASRLWDPVRSRAEEIAEG